MKRSKKSVASTDSTSTDKQPTQDESFNEQYPAEREAIFAELDSYTEENHGLEAPYVDYFRKMLADIRAAAPDEKIILIECSKELHDQESDHTRRFIQGTLEDIADRLGNHYRHPEKTVRRMASIALTEWFNSRIDKDVTVQVIGDMAEAKEYWDRTLLQMAIRRTLEV